MSKLASDPTFSRSEVATILDVTNQTIAAREKAGKYPKPKRDLNDYRYYTLEDIFNLQLITFNALQPNAILVGLYAKGYRDQAKMSTMVDKVLSNFYGK